MKRVLLFMTMAVGILAANCQQSSPTDEETTVQPEVSDAIEMIEVAQLKQMLSDSSEIQLFDIRTPKEYGEGTIGPAQNINFFDSDFGTQMLEATDKEQPIYIFCRSGRRSGRAARKLKTLGFKEIYDLKGGYLAWSKEN
jgi:rhodanese-related sulfurtransferase